MTMRFPILAAVVLGLCLTLSSVFSAVQMTPDRAAIDREIYLNSTASLLEELCADEGAHAHGCPFCHALPEAPALAFSGSSRKILPWDGWRAARSLHRAAQGRDRAHPTRAPPLT